MAAERPPSRALGELLSVEWLASSADCLKERACVDVIPVFDGDVRMVFVKSGFLTRGLPASSDSCDGGLNAARVWKTERSVLDEEKVYAGEELEAEKKLLHSFVLIRGKSDGKENM